MKKLSGWSVFWIVLGSIIFILGAWGVGSYNGLVGLRESVDNQSANIETQLQRRADLIPNLVNTVKKFASHESDILTQISNARAKLAGAKTMPDRASADTELSGALSRLLVIVENYPTLKADTQFTNLMDELAGTENRISVARKDYNDSVKNYNNRIKTFPANIIANMFGFSSADYFQAANGSNTAPAVNFSQP